MQHTRSFQVSLYKITIIILRNGKLPALHMSSDEDRKRTRYPFCVKKGNKIPPNKTTYIAKCFISNHADGKIYR